MTTSAHAIAPGLLLAGVIAVAARYLSEHYGGPAMLFALLIGIAFNFLAEGEKTGAGVRFACRDVLRVGVALLGARITLGEIGDLGAPVLCLAVAGVAVTILVGGAIGRAFGLSRDHATLSAAAVAICGASAALAVAAVLPRHGESERNTILTVVGVTTLSTLAMMVYPLIAAALSFDDRAAGVFIGATIHDVAQVVGAGYSISDVAGENAAVVKLLRVTCLTPAVLAIGFAFRGRPDAATKRPLVPAFLVAFVLLVAVNSAGFIPEVAQGALGAVSQWCLLVAVAALGVRTSLKELTAVGPKPMLALGAQTILLAAFVAAGLKLLGL